MKDRSLDAMNVLSTASLMHCTAIPLSVLGRATFTDCTDDLERHSRMNSSMSTLTAFSLVQEDREKDTCALHSLIQQAVEEHMMREGTLLARLQSTCRYILTILPQTWDGCCRQLKDSRLLALTPHLYSIADTVLSTEMLTCHECWQLLQIVCWLAIEYGHLDKARSLTERRLGIARRTFNDELILSDARKLVQCKRIHDCFSKLMDVYCDAGFLEVGRVHSTLLRVESAITNLQQAMRLVTSASVEVGQYMGDLMRSGKAG